MTTDKKTNILISTLGSEAQVVSLAWQKVQEEGYTVPEIIVVHTDAGREPVRSALTRLADFFKPFDESEIRLRLAAVGEDQPVSDTVTEEDLEAVFATLYRTVLQSKVDGKVVHLCIVGGRKIMSAYGVTVAQLLFDDDDRLWYLLSAGEVLAKKRMLALEGDDVKLVPIPVFHWSPIPPVLTELAMIRDPWQALMKQQQLRHRQEYRRKRDFVERILTRAEREVVALLVREGLSNEAIAERLHRSVRTVGNHLSHVYDKLHEFLGFREGVPTDRAVVIAELSSVFLMGEELANIEK